LHKAANITVFNCRWFICAVH